MGAKAEISATLLDSAALLLVCRAFIPCPLSHLRLKIPHLTPPVKRTPLQRFVPFRLALLIAPLLAAWPQQSHAADGAYNGATSGTWHTLTNWTPNTGFPGAAAAVVAGEGAGTDIASAVAANAATNVGINLNTMGGLLELGAIDWNKTNTATCTIGNNSTTVSGILQLNGATVNAVAGTLLRVNSEGSLTLSNVNTGSAAVTMGLRLGLTNGIFFVGQNGATTPALRTLTINSIISEVAAGSGFTKTGTGVLTLTAANQMTGNLTVSDGSLRLQNAAAAGSGIILLTNGDGAAVNNNDVLITGGLTYTNAITLENSANQNARVRLQSTSTVNANPNTWAGNITFKGPSSNQTILAESAPLIINGNFLQDGATPSPSLFIRGGSAAAPGTMNGNIFLGNGALFKTDGGTWTINSTGNNMGNVICADGLLILNNNDALEADTTIQMGQGSGTTGRMQINAGFTQQITSLFTPFTGTLSSSLSGHFINGPGALDVGGTSRSFNIGENTATFNELTINAPITGSGGFTKLQAGNLIVNSTVTGPVTVSAGGVTGIGTFSGGVTVNAGAALGGGQPLGAGTLTVAGATLDAGSNLAMNLGSSGNDFIANTGSLVSAGTVINVIPNGSFTTGQSIPIIGYSGAPPATAAFTIGGILGSRASATLGDSGSAITLNITAADKVIWTGATDANFDIATTSNWKLASDSSPATFQQYDALVFNDTGANTTITLSVAATPVRAEFANTIATPYVIGGTGSLGGTMVLDKTGDGTVTFATTNSYTGAANVAAGTLIANYNPGLAATALLIPLPAASPVNIGPGAKVQAIANDGLATGTVIAITPVLSGSGTLEINPHAVAAGTLAVNATMTADNSAFTGTLNLLAPASGTWRLNNPSQTNLGGATINVESGAQLILTSRTINNPITIAGTGFSDTNGFIGALRIDTSTYSGNVTVAAGGARIGAHASTGVVSGNISGGPLEVNVSNYANSYTVHFTGANSYTTTTIGGGATQATASVSMRLNIGNGGTTGTLGSGGVFLNGDGVPAAANGTNGVLGFDRSNGYTLAQTITGGGTNLQRTFIDFDTLGAGFNTNGNKITLGNPVTGGNLRIAQARAGASAAFDSEVIAQILRVGSGQQGTLNLNAGANVKVGTVSLASTATTASGSVLNINPGASLTAEGPDVGTGDQANNSTAVNQSGGTFTVGTGAVAARFRHAHYPNETSTYHLTGGDLNIVGPAPGTTPSIPGNPEVSGGLCVGVDGTGIFNQSGGSTVTTNFVLLDARGAATTNATPGEDQYNHNGGSLSLTSNWGIISRHPSSARFTLNGGTISNNAPSGTAVMFDTPVTAGAAGGTLDTINASSSFVLTGSVTGAGSTIVTAGGGRLTLLPNSKTVLDGVSDGLGTTSIDVNLRGDAGVEKTGTGITTLAGTNTYSGGTTISAGTLVVNGSVTGTGTVATGGILAGNGTLGAVTAANGGVVSPGFNVGALNFASLNLLAGSRYDVEITAAATADKLNVTGTLNASGTIKVTLSGYVPASGNTFDIADAAAFSGAPTFDFSAAVLTAGLAWDSSQFLTNGTISVIPDDPFIAWAAGFGLTGGKNGDDDGDGASNLLEFATNSDPTTGGSGARAYGRIHALGAENVLTLTVAVRKSAVFAASGSKQTATKDKVVYTVEGSDDLAIWNTVVVTELNAADSAAVQAALTLPSLGADWEWHTFRTDGSTLLDPRDMIRLSVTAE